MTHVPPGFWLSSLPDGPACPAQQGDSRVDVAIIGGGFAGLSTAFSLRRKDPSLRVAVLEAQRVGHGASGRNAGFAMTLFGLTVQTTALRFGRRRTREAHEFMTRAVSYVEHLCRHEGVACDFEMSGLLTVATSKAYERRLRAELETAHRCGIEGLEWLDAAATRARVDSPAYRGARWEPHSALVHPARLVRELRRLALEAGAEVFEDTPVQAIEVPRSAGAPVVIQTAGGCVRAERVVFATNAWSAAFPALRAKQFPVFTYIVLTEPLSERHMTALRWAGREGIEDARALIHYYRLTPDNRLLMGGGDAFYFLGGGVGARGGTLGHDTHAQVVPALQATVRSLFPSLRDIGFTHAWGGPVSVPLDFAPAMGRVGGDRRLIYSLGCVGHGVSLMTMAGQILSDLALDRETELTDLFFVNRFVPPMPPDPVRWVLAQGIRGAMKLADRFDDR